MNIVEIKNVQEYESALEILNNENYSEEIAYYTYLKNTLYQDTDGTWNISGTGKEMSERDSFYGAIILPKNEALDSNSVFEALEASIKEEYSEYKMTIIDSMKYEYIEGIQCFLRGKDCRISRVPMDNNSNRFGIVITSTFLTSEEDTKDFLAFILNTLINEIDNQ